MIKIKRMGSANNMNPEIIKEMHSLNDISYTWKDYVLLLLNSTPDPLRRNWREKIMSSLISCEFKNISISEGNLAGWELLIELPEWLTIRVNGEDWKNINKIRRLSGSKKMSVNLMRLPLEPLSYQAFKCCEYLIDNFEVEIHERKTGKDIIEEIPLLNRIWDFSYHSKGDCLYPDEVLTYTLDKDLDIKKSGEWITASEDVFANGRPSNRFDKYWVSDKVEWFPNTKVKTDKIRKAYFLNVCKIMFKEDILEQPSWKRFAIAILKNDIFMVYCGFSRPWYVYEERESSINQFNEILKSIK